MFRKTQTTLILIVLICLTGCMYMSVPMAPVEEDELRKQFAPPSQGRAGLYIYRNQVFGTILTPALYVDGELVGETAVKTYFYREIEPGKRKISTESEFGPEFGQNDLILQAEDGKNHFVHQSIKMGLIIGGSNLSLVSEEKGKKGVLECKLAK